MASLSGLGDTAADGTLTPDTYSTYAKAKDTLQANINRLKALRYRAVALKNLPAIAKIDAQLNEANSLQSNVSEVDKMIAPFLSVWDKVKGWFGLSSLAEVGSLGELGFIPILIGVVAVGAIGTAIYGIHTWSSKTETVADQLDAEMAAQEKLQKTGLTATQARAEVLKTVGNKIADDQANSGSSWFGDILTSPTKIIGGLLLIGGGYALWTNRDALKGHANTARAVYENRHEIARQVVRNVGKKKKRK